MDDAFVDIRRSNSFLLKGPTSNVNVFNFPGTYCMNRADSPDSNKLLYMSFLLPSHDSCMISSQLGQNFLCCCGGKAFRTSKGRFPQYSRICDDWNDPFIDFIRPSLPSTLLIVSKLWLMPSSVVQR